jgi:hypothetical protein
MQDITQHRLSFGRSQSHEIYHAAGTTISLTPNLAPKFVLRPFGVCQGSAKRDVGGQMSFALTRTVKLKR